MISIEADTTLPIETLISREQWWHHMLSRVFGGAVHQVDVNVVRGAVRDKNRAKTAAKADAKEKRLRRRTEF